MKELRRWEEDNRAFRISLRMTENHKLLASVYENLVDRNFLTAEKDIKILPKFVKITKYDNNIKRRAN